MKHYRFAYDQPNTTAYGLAAKIFDEKLAQLSGGKMGINQFPGAQLGTALSHASFHEPGMPSAK